MRDDAPETGVGLFKVTIHATLPDLICATFIFVINHHHYFPYICNALPFDSLLSSPALKGFAVHRPSEMNIIVTTIIHYKEDDYWMSVSHGRVGGWGGGLIVIMMMMAILDVGQPWSGGWKGGLNEGKGGR